MKKNRMMRLASGLLVAVLMTTSMISGTFAKYVTTASASDNARVAKWGVTLAANGLLYSEVYDDVANGNDGNADSTSATVETYQKNNVKQSLVAPGTVNPGTGLSFTLDGRPEVDVALTGTLTAETTVLPAATYVVVNSSTVNDGGDIEATTTIEETLATAYYPVEYTLVKDGINVVVDKTLLDVCATIDDIYSASAENSVTDAKVKTVQYSYTDADAATKDCEANHDLGSLVDATGTNDGVYTLTWKWDFANTDKDVFDTFLGDLAYAAVGGENGNEISDSNVVCKAKSDGSKFCSLAAYAMLDPSAQAEFTDSVTAGTLANYGIGITEAFAMSITATQID